MFLIRKNPNYNNENIGVILSKTHKFHKMVNLELEKYTFCQKIPAGFQELNKVLLVIEISLGKSEKNYF